MNIITELLVPGAKRHPRMAFLGKYASINPAKEIGFLESNLTEARFVNSGKLRVAYRLYIRICAALRIQYR